MNMFESKKIDRKIGPKFGDEDNNGVINQFKPKLYEDQINFDRMRMYRLNRVKEQLSQNDIGACILFDPINIRYATDTRNMSMFTMHIISRYVFIPAEGPVILFEYPKSEHLAEGICTVDEIRNCIVHRINKVMTNDDQRELITKGDNNKFVDQWTITESDYIGYVILVIPEIGIITRILTPLSTPPVNYIIIGIILLLLFLEHEYK